MRWGYLNNSHKALSQCHVRREFIVGGQTWLIYLVAVNEQTLKENLLWRRYHEKRFTVYWHELWRYFSNQRYIFTLKHTFCYFVCSINFYYLNVVDKPIYSTKTPLLFAGLQLGYPIIYSNLLTKTCRCNFKQSYKKLKVTF